MYRGSAEDVGEAGPAEAKPSEGFSPTPPLPTFPLSPQQSQAARRSPFVGLNNLSRQRFLKYSPPRARVPDPHPGDACRRGAKRPPPRRCARIYIDNVYTLCYDSNVGNGIDFDWDAENTKHLAAHQVTAREFESVMRNSPLDLAYELVDGE